MKSFEQGGIPREQAEQMAEHLTRLIITTKSKLEDSFVRHQFLEKVGRRRWQNLPCTQDVCAAADCRGGGVLVWCGRGKPWHVCALWHGGDPRRLPQVHTPALSGVWLGQPR